MKHYLALLPEYAYANSLQNIAELVKSSPYNKNHYSVILGNGRDVFWPIDWCYFISEEEYLEVKNLANALLTIKKEVR